MGQPRAHAAVAVLPCPSTHTFPTCRTRQPSLHRAFSCYCYRAPAHVLPFQHCHLQDDYTPPHPHPASTRVVLPHPAHCVALIRAFCLPRYALQLRSELPAHCCCDRSALTARRYYRLEGHLLRRCGTRRCRCCARIRCPACHLLHAPTLPLPTRTLQATLARWRGRFHSRLAGNDLRARCGILPAYYCARCLRHFWRAFFFCHTSLPLHYAYPSGDVRSLGGYLPPPHHDSSHYLLKEEKKKKKKGLCLRRK